MEKTIGIFDNETGEQIVREMNNQELEAYAISLADIKKNEEKVAEALAAKEVALAKLAALGLDLDDLKSLGF